MMKKTLLSMVMLMSALTIVADDYPYLTFETQDGSVKSVSTTSLTLTISGNELIVNDGACSFQLSDLSKMYFSTSDATGIEQLTSNLSQEEEVYAYTADGIFVGRFDNLRAAQNTLKQGLYIFKSNGKTLKVTVK